MPLWALIAGLGLGGCALAGVVVLMELNAASSSRLIRELLTNQDRRLRLTCSALENVEKRVRRLEGNQ